MNIEQARKYQQMLARKQARTKAPFSGVSNFIAKNAPGFTSRLRTTMNKPANLTQKQAEALQNVSYAAPKFLKTALSHPLYRGIDILSRGGLSRTLDPTDPNSWITRNLLSGVASSTTAGNKAGETLGTIAELTPALIYGLAGGSTFKTGKLSQLPTLAQKTISTILPNAAIGAGINKAFGGSLLEGAKQGLLNMPTTVTIGQFTNPLISKITGGAYDKVNNPLVRQLVTRGVSGALNVGEGKIMDISLGQKTTPTSVAIDLVSGILLVPDANIELKNQLVNAISDNNIDAFEQTIKQAKNNGVKINDVKVKEAEEVMKKPELSKQDRIKLLDEQIKNEPDLAKRGLLMAERNKLLNDIDPDRISKQKELEEFLVSNKKKNEEVAYVSKQLKPVNQRLLEIKQEIIDAGRKAKGSVKGSPEWKKMNDLVKERDALILKQKSLVSQRDIKPVEQIKIKTELPKVVEKVRPVEVKSAPVPKAGITEPAVTPEKIEKESAPINKTYMESIYPIELKIKELARKKGLSIEDLVEQRKQGTLEDKEIKRLWDDMNNEYWKMENKVSDTPVPKRESYMPDPPPGSQEQIRREVSGGNFFDDVAGENYDFRKPQTSKGEPHKTKDFDLSYRTLLDRIKYDANKIAIDAERNGLKEESQRILNERAKEMKEQIAKSGESDVDIIGMTRDIAKNEEMAMDDIVLKEVTFGQKKFKDIYQVLDELGLRDQLYRFINSKPIAKQLKQEVSDLVSKGDFDSAIDIVHSKYPIFSVDDAKSTIYWTQQRKGNPLETMGYLIDSLVKKDAMRNLLEVLPRLKMSNKGATRNYINDSLNLILSSEAKTNNLLVKFQEQVRRHTTAGFLGLNPNSMIQNMTEPRRLFGVVHPKYILEGSLNTTKQLGGKRAISRYGFDDDKRYAERFFKSKQAKSLIGKLDDEAIEKVMIPFRASEQLKDDVFLNIFEAEGRGNGLEGDALVRYVTHKFRKYAIHGDDFGTLGMFNTGILGLKPELTKNIFQFAQYPIRDLGILQSKIWNLGREPKDSIQYILSYALTSMIVYKIYEAIGLNGLNAALSLPVGLQNQITKDRSEDRYNKKTVGGEIWEAFRNISPNTAWAYDIGDFITDYFTNNLEGEDKVAAFRKQRVIKDFIKRIPAGSQILKTGGYIKNLQQGYQPNTTGNMRFPVTAENPWEVAKGVMFGSNTTKYGKEFWKDYQSGMAPSTKEVQLDKYKQMVASGDREGAVKYWKKGYEDKKRYFTASNKAYDSLEEKEKSAYDSIPKSDPNDPLVAMYTNEIYLKYPAVFEAKKNAAIESKQGDLSKVDPLYTTDSATARNYVLWKSLPPNSQDAKSLKKAHPEIVKLAEVRSKFFEENPIEGVESTYKAPKPSEYVQKQMDAKNWKDPQVKAYLEAYRVYTNEQRAKIGLEPIPEYESSYNPMKYFNPTVKKVRMKKVKSKKISFKKPKKIKTKYKKLKVKKLAVTPIRGLNKKIKIPELKNKKGNIIKLKA